MLLLDRLGERLGVVQIGVAGLPPQQVGVFRIRQAARDAVVQTRAGLQADKAFGRTVLAFDEGLVALIDVRGDQLGAFGIGSIMAAFFVAPARRKWGSEAVVTASTLCFIA